MSFGWSVGDIGAALGLLHKVAGVLKDMGGASSDYQESLTFLYTLSATLQNLKSLQSAPLDLDVARNLGQLCQQVQGPLTAFCTDIHTRFESDLGTTSTRLNIFTTHRKLQWALSTSKKVKALRERIGEPLVAIGIVLGHQIVQTSLQLPSEIQARISQSLDAAFETRISPLALTIRNDVKAISAAQRTSDELICAAIREIGSNTKAEIQKQSEETTHNLGDIRNSPSLSQERFTKGMARIEDQSETAVTTLREFGVDNRTAAANVQGKLSGLSLQQAQSTDIASRRVVQMGQETAHEIQRLRSTSQEQTLNLQKKLDRMNWLMVTVKDRMSDLSNAQQSTMPGTASLEIQQAMRNIQRGVWLLASALHILIREFINLLAPYLAAIYCTSIEPLLRCGDHFLFEDAIGRRKWLPCLQFQHWETFYDLLIDSFQGEKGLSKVLNGQFMVLNGFNETPIQKKSWRSGIQPKARVAMAIMLDASSIQKGKCVDPSCPGQVDFEKSQITLICPICRKHLSRFEGMSTQEDDFSTVTTFSFNFGSNIQMPISEGATRPGLRSSVVQPAIRNAKVMTGSSIDRDIAAFKRIIWQQVEKLDHEAYIKENSPAVSGVQRRKLPLRNQRGGLLIRKKNASQVRRTPPATTGQRQVIIPAHAKDFTRQNGIHLSNSQPAPNADMVTQLHPQRGRRLSFGDSSIDMSQDVMDFIPNNRNIDVLQDFDFDSFLHQRPQVENDLDFFDPFSHKVGRVDDPYFESFESFDSSCTTMAGAGWVINFNRGGFHVVEENAI